MENQNKQEDHSRAMAMNTESIEKAVDKQMKERCLQLAVSSLPHEDTDDIIERAEAFYNFITN